MGTGVWIAGREFTVKHPRSTYVLIAVVVGAFVTLVLADCPVVRDASHRLAAVSASTEVRPAGEPRSGRLQRQDQQPALADDRRQPLGLPRHRHGDRVM